MADKMDFFSQLFDFSFKAYVTPRIIKFIYILGLAVAGFACLSMLLGAFSKSFIGGMFMLIGSPVIFILMATAFRIYMEVLIVIFSIADNVKDIAEVLKNERKSNGNPDQTLY